MTDRDELAMLIFPLLDDRDVKLDWTEAQLIADAILARWELTPYKACGHPDRYDLDGGDDGCLACAIERGPEPKPPSGYTNLRIFDKDGNVVD